MSKPHPNGPRNFWGKVEVDRRPRVRSKAVIACETLEGRALLAAGLGSSTVSTFTAAVTQLQTDLHAIAAKSQVTVSELTALSDALQKDQTDATSRPTSASVSTLQTEIATEAQAGTLNTATLLSDEAAILTSAGDPTADVTATTTAQSAIFTSSAITGTDLKTIYTDLHAIQNATPAHGGFGGFGGFGGLGGFGGITSGPTSQTTTVLSSILNLPFDSLSHLSGNHPTPPTPAPTPSPVQVAQAKLQTDLHTLAAKSQVTVAQLTTLSDAVQKAQKDATNKPTAASLSALVTEIATEAQAGTLSPSTIEADLAAVLTSAGVPTADSTAVTQALDAVITASGITGADLQLIYNDEQAIKAAIAANPPGHHGPGH
jgi:hypothetical protein